MIAYFPQIYPDELMYSLLARYYIKSGYPCYWYAANDLFEPKTVSPDIEFVNQYTPAALQMITKEMSMEDVVLNHTMFPYYGRFLPKERRNKAFEALVQLKGNYHNLLIIPKQKKKSIRYLRYCPMCANADRKKYRETYWHRIHQMQGINICPIHKCYLVDSNLMIHSKTSPNLVAAELVVPINAKIVMCESKVECELSEYIITVFQEGVDLQSDILAGDFLHSRMSGTKYLSVRGEQRNIALFRDEFTEYFKNTSQNEFTELWQIQKILTNDRIRLLEICMMAMFLNVPTADLVHMKLPEQTQEQRFDEQVYKLHKQGLKYPEIARILNASINVVKPVGEKRYGTNHKESETALKSRKKSYNWQQIDKDTLSFVKEAINKLQGDGVNRPKKVTIFAIEKMLNLPSKRISLYLPMCKAEIKKYEESHEQYWARNLVWAYQKLKSEKGDMPFYWSDMRKISGVNKKNMSKIIPYLRKIADEELVEKITKIVGENA